MIIQFHLTPWEDTEIADHLKQCDDTLCDDIAHVCAALVDKYDGVAEVFTFVDSSKWRHQKKLDRVRQRGQRESERATSRNQRQTSLAIIRRAWDRLEAAADAESAPATPEQPATHTAPP